MGQYNEAPAMENVYVSPPFVASFKSSTTEARRTANNFLSINGYQERDENENELYVGATESTKKLKFSEARDDKDECAEIRRRTRKSPNREGRKMTGVEFDTPSGTITSTTFHVGGTSPDKSPPTKSPIYCFHSFTYGVGVPGENEVSQTRLVSQCDTIWEEESFDADSPNVWRTRAVVDPVDSGSPTFHSMLPGLLSSEEILNSESIEKLHSEIHTSFPKTAASVFKTSKQEEKNGQSPLNSGHRESGDLTENVCERSAMVKFVERQSPEGAESYAQRTLYYTSAGSHLAVPKNQLLYEAQMINKFDNGLSCSPSGYIDTHVEWEIEETKENPKGKEVMTGDCHDRVPLIPSVKPHVRYDLEEGFEETEEGTPVSCLKCLRCALL